MNACEQIFINYYEILVRNAFGNLRSILKEVSYSGLMASYLTFQNSESLAASGTLPDENVNVAREHQRKPVCPFRPLTTPAYDARLRRPRVACRSFLTAVCSRVDAIVQRGPH